MKVVGINTICKWLQIYSDSGRHYTCWTKEINGELFFKFKNEWHRVADYLTKNTTELVQENGKVFSRLVSK